MEAIQDCNAKTDGRLELKTATIMAPINKEVMQIKKTLEELKELRIELSVFQEQLK